MNVGDNAPSVDEIGEAMEVFHAHKKIQQAQKSRGLNDLNLFTALLKKTDEVRLHSKFLHLLLDVTGGHGQEGLFVELFLKECELTDFGIDVSKCRVHREYRNIDLYLTDGIKHIIIENKINAGDQEKQIERYIDIIRDENKNDRELEDNLVVIYLSLDRNAPGKDSLGGFKCDQNKLVRMSESYRYLSLNYDKEILSWIKKSREQVQNITNLSLVLNQYEEVILKLYNKYEDKLMSLKEYMDNSDKDVIGLLKSFKAVSTQYGDLRNSYMEELFDSVNIELNKEVQDGWKVELSDSLTSKRTPLISIYAQNNSKIIFTFEFEGNNSYIGLVAKDEVVGNSLCKKQDEILSLLGGVKDKLDSVAKGFKGDRWLGWSTYCKGDLFDHMLENGSVQNEAIEMREKIMVNFNNYKDVITQCNNIIGDI